MKPAQEFFSTDDVAWVPGFDSTNAGPVTHEHVEEVLILSGSMRDVRLDAVFGAGSYASRPPGMVHGPWVSEEGCVMLETRYLPAD